MGALESPGTTCCHTDEKGFIETDKEKGDPKDGANGPMWEMEPVEGAGGWLGWAAAEPGQQPEGSPAAVQPPAGADCRAGLESGKPAEHHHLDKFCL